MLYDQHGRVLLLQREDDPTFWQSVTGSMENGELPIDTAYREVAEETGLDLVSLNIPIIDCGKTNEYVIRKAWIHRYPPGTTTNIEHVFRAQIDSAFILTLTEHLDFIWLDKPTAIRKAWSDTNKSAIATFIP